MRLVKQTVLYFKEGNSAAILAQNRIEAITEEVEIDQTTYIEAVAT